MKLNLWMIANRLHELEPELHIPDQAPVNLRSARRAYATSCVYVYQKENNVICDAGEEGGWIVFKDAKCDHIFEMVQYTFDFFEDWFLDILDCVDRMDYESIIDKSWTVFHNPIILLDAGNHLLARSRQYQADEVNYDWKYLCEHGCSAVSVIQYLMEIGKHDGYYTNGKAKIYHFPENACVGTEISVAIYGHDALLGRMNIVERDRKLNAGDLYLADRLVKFLAQIFVNLGESRISNRVLYPVLSKMLLGQPVVTAETDYWKAYTNWTSEDELQVIVLELPEENTDIDRLILICNLIQNVVPYCLATHVENNIGFIYQVSESGDEITDQIQDIVERFCLTVGISASFQGIDHLNCYYDQAKTAIRMGKRSEPDKTVHEFYPYAIDYILLSDQIEKSVLAVHPDIRKLWSDGEENGGDQIVTLQVYLEKDRSLKYAAEALFIHRSSLIYRLQKITDKLTCDLENGYTRDYMKLSIRLLQLYHIGSTKI